jgi:glutamate dehydrogenase/leucine dehydrogenase
MEVQPSPAVSPGAITSTLGERKQDKARRTWSKASTTDALRRSVDGNFYKIAQLVGPADQDLLRQVRAFAEEKIAPIINQYEFGAFV